MDGYTVRGFLGLQAMDSRRVPPRQYMVEGGERRVNAALTHPLKKKQYRRRPYKKNYIALYTVGACHEDGLAARRGNVVEGGERGVDAVGVADFCDDRVVPPIEADVGERGQRHVVVHAHEDHPAGKQKGGAE